MFESLVSQSEEIAHGLLAEVLPVRWKHVQSVAHKAERIGAALLEPDEAKVLISAAWLHDIGYAPGLIDVKFHPIDGARWLRKNGFNERVLCLVANHTCASIDAEIRGLVTELQVFSNEKSLVTDCLFYCDSTTGPKGQPLNVRERMEEVQFRFKDNPAVLYFVERARPAILAMEQRMNERLRAANMALG